MQGITFSRNAPTVAERLKVAAATISQHHWRGPVNCLGQVRPDLDRYSIGGSPRPRSLICSDVGEAFNTSETEGGDLYYELAEGQRCHVSLHACPRLLYSALQVLRKGVRAILAGVSGQPDAGLSGR